MRRQPVHERQLLGLTPGHNPLKSIKPKTLESGWAIIASRGKPSRCASAANLMAKHGDMPLLPPSRGYGQSLGLLHRLGRFGALGQNLPGPSERRMAERETVIRLYCPLERLLRANISGEKPIDTVQRRLGTGGQQVVVAVLEYNPVSRGSKRASYVSKKRRKRKRPRQARAFGKLSRTN